MTRVVLVDYIFHEMDERSKDVPTTKAERKKDEWKLGESNVSSFKRSKNMIKQKREGFLLLFSNYRLFL